MLNGQQATYKVPRGSKRKPNKTGDAEGPVEELTSGHYRRSNLFLWFYDSAITRRLDLLYLLQAIISMFLILLWTTKGMCNNSTSRIS